MTSEQRGLGQRDAVRERDRNERVAQIVKAHRLPPLPVQAHLVSGVLDSAEGVAPGLWLATAGAEHQRVAAVNRRLRPACRERCARSSRSRAAISAAEARYRPLRIFGAALLALGLTLTTIANFL